MNPVSCTPQDVSGGHTGVAFALVAAAGLSTTLGAALAFVMPYRAGEKNLFLAGSLAVAAGVMIYVSFVEIFSTKAVAALSACVDDRFAYLYASLCLFFGIFLTWLFDRGVHFLQHYLCEKEARKAALLQSSDAEISSANFTTQTTTESLQQVVDTIARDAVARDAIARDAVARDAIARDAVARDAVARDAVAETVQPPSADGDIERQPQSNNPDDTKDSDEIQIHRAINIPQEVAHDGNMVANAYRTHAHNSRALVRMGIFAGIAIGFHNFPEGLATFVAALHSAKVGASVAIAIGIHNIPEGICVAMPIFYATNSRKKAFFWATLSGLTEVLGALLGWIVLRKVFNQVVYGILFGVVAGMMIYISVKELLPTAHRYDRDDSVTTVCLILGMVIMAASLIMFKF